MLGSSDYYNIDDILCEGEMVPAQFNIDGYDVGYLDTSNAEDDIKQGAKVDLPYWLTVPLSAQNIVKIGFPKFFQPQFRSALLADPMAVELNSYCEFWYEFGLKLAAIAEERNLYETLQVAYGARFVHIIEKSAVWRSSDFFSFTGKLTNAELELFALKYVSESANRNWRTGNSGKLQAPEHVKLKRKGGNKRKTPA